jgi:hypothetical protein
MSTPYNLFRISARTIPFRRQPISPVSKRIHPFSTSRPLARATHRKESFGSRLGKAWRRTPVKWKPIPVALGIAFLGVFQFYRIQERERKKQEEEWLQEHHNGDEEGEIRGRRRKRERIRPSGPRSASRTPTPRRGTTCAASRASGQWGYPRPTWPATDPQPFLDVDPHLDLLLLPPRRGSGLAASTKSASIANHSITF